MEWWHFWWLIFPLMGVLGGAARAWERNARGRHQRRLEILHAKSELKAAGRAPGVRADLAAPEKSSERLVRVMAAHDATTARWLEYELDVAKVIAFPAMSDGRQDLTAAFLRAKRVADGLRPASDKARLTDAQLAEYRAAVTDYEVAFDLAERDARRIKDSSFTDAERKRLDTAKQLLTVAIDGAATPAERQLAYRRARQELDGLVSLSDAAIDRLEERVMLELPAGASTTDDSVAVSLTPPAPRESLPGARETSPDPRATPAAPRESIPATTRVGVVPGRVVRPKPTL